MGKASKRQSKGNSKPKTKKPYRDPGKRRNATDFSAKVQKPEDNPFEIRINRKKHDNLGRVNKNERGRPGISRSKAVEKVKFYNLLSNFAKFQFLIFNIFLFRGKRLC